MNIYAFVSNVSTLFIDPDGRLISWPWRRRRGFLSGDPWFEHPTRRIYVGRQRVLTQPSLWNPSGYRWEDVYWNVDYEVLTNFEISIEIAGRNIRGELDSGTLFTINTRRFWHPRLGLDGAIREASDNDKWIICRKRVVCKAKCECSDENWVVDWRPSDRSLRYVYGKMVESSLGISPTCDVFPSEEANAERACTEIDARNACGEE